MKTQTHENGDQTGQQELSIGEKMVRKPNFKATPVELPSAPKPKEEIKMKFLKIKNKKEVDYVGISEINPPTFRIGQQSIPAHSGSSLTKPVLRIGFRYRLYFKTMEATEEAMAKILAWLSTGKGVVHEVTGEYTTSSPDPEGL